MFSSSVDETDAREPLKSAYSVGTAVAIPGAMEWRKHGTTRSFLSIFVLCQIVCCALSFDLYAESGQPAPGADNAVSVGDSPASGFDTRLNKKALRVYGPMNSGGASVISQLTPDMVAKMFPGAPRANIEKYLPLIRRALAERDLVDKAMVLMAMATVRVETFTFAPISEAPSPLNTQPPGPPFNKYDHRPDLGNQGPPDGAKFKGRGFIQLTGRKNYEYYGAMLGYNLIGNPDLANAPQPAARILAAYLNENEAAIRSALATGDLATARKTVNGGGNGVEGFRAAFLLGHKLIRGNDRDLAFLKEPPERREIRKVKAVSISNPASRSSKSSAKKRDDDNVIAKKRDDDRDGKSSAKKRDRDDDRDGKSIAKKRDDDRDGKASAKKRDDDKDGKASAKKRDDDKDGKTKGKKRDDDKGDKDGNKETDGKSKKKGFFLFRVFRSIP